jgi:hypothetical protein
MAVSFIKAKNTLGDFKKQLTGDIVKTFRNSMSTVGVYTLIMR